MSVPLKRIPVVDSVHVGGSFLKRHWPAVLILAAYLLVGLFYASYTPVWQAPDEPAHYNYIRSLAEGRGIPVMDEGDYDQAYIVRLTTEGFPPELSIASLEYEDHQPPLYYLLAAPLFALSSGNVVVLRLFSVVLGAGVVAVIMAIVLEVFPDRPCLAWLAGGLVAFLPQHVAMVSAVNNDALTELLLASWVLLALRYLRNAVHPAVLGVVLGALFLTKTTGYGAAILSVLVVFLRWRRGGFSWKWAVNQGVLIFGPGLLLGSLWWVRNWVVYGWPDFMGLLRHNEIVVGQPRTADFLARDGAWAFYTGALRTTFRSFWGQFGWMGVVLDSRIYLGVGLLSAVMAWGALWRLGEGVAAGFEPRVRDALILLGVSALITFGLYIFYNFTFVQHQGRYLFPALPPLALAGAVGLRRVTEKRLAVMTSLLFVIVAVIFGLLGLLGQAVSLWSLALIGGCSVAVLAAGLAPRRFLPAFGGILLLGLFALDFLCLFGFIIPMLA